MSSKIQTVRKDAAAAFWPDCESDYIRIRRLLIAKPLFVAALLVLNAVFIYILLIIWGSMPVVSADGIRSYRHSSIRLRRYTGVATVLDKDKNPIYTGSLVKGKATGYGELKDRDGAPIYSGEFLENRYNGEGELYYPDGAVKYQGQFKNNLFDGTGNLYRQNGIKSYEGGFSMGKRQGEGILFDVSGTTVYTGLFVDDNIFFEGYIGRESQSLGDFGGARTLYDSTYYTAVALRGFGVIYVMERGVSDEAGSGIVRMYDVSGAASQFSEPCTAKELREAMGEPFYEGYADILAPDMAAAEELKLLGKLPRDSGLNYEMQPITEGIYEVGFDSGQKLYLESYGDGEWFYTYYFLQKTQTYLFYSVERAGDSNAEE